MHGGKQRVHEAGPRGNKPVASVSEQMLRCPPRPNSQMKGQLATVSSVTPQLKRMKAPMTLLKTAGVSVAPGATAVQVAAESVTDAVAVIIAQE